MNFIKFIVWLVAGAVVGWVVDIENRQRPEKMIPVEN